MRTNSSNNTIGGPAAADGNLISGNKGHGIYVLFGGPANDNVFENNDIGTDASGTEPLGNGGDGIGFFAPSAHNQILNNLISGNGGSGISFFGSDSSDALIQGNLIGTDKDGIGPIGNGGKGIDVGGPPRTRIIDNVISANRGPGVNIGFDTTVNTVIQGNLIGVAKDGVHALGNQNEGVQTSFGASNAQVGGTGPGQGNVIAYNAFTFTFTKGGVDVDSSSTGISVEGNTIYSNYGLGIDLGGDGVTPNTPGGPHTGANDRQNYPVLTSVATAGSSATVTGTLNSTPNTTFHLEFFASPGTDPTGYGEGQALLGAAAVTTDGAGNATFSASVSAPPGPGWYVAATATDSGGNTSEFSAAVRGTPPLADLTAGLSASSGAVLVGDAIVYTVTATNHGPLTATNVVLKDTLPSGVTYQSAAASQGTATVSGSTVTDQLGSPAPGATATLTVTVQAAAAGSLVDRASVSSDQLDPNPGDNAATVTTTASAVLSNPVIGLSSSLASPSYGDSLSFTATVAAPGTGLPTPTGTVQFLVDGLPLGSAVALVNGAATSPAVTTLAAGTHAVSVSYSGDPAYNPGGVGPQTLSVGKAHLTVATDSKAMTYGGTMPGLTYTLTGFVNGDTAAVVTGSPTLSTAANASSPPGTYPITVAAGSLAAANYDFPTLVGATLTVKPEVGLDFDCAGHAEPAVFRPASSQWFVGGPAGGHALTAFGAPGLGDIPVSGDFDGVGHAEQAVFRPSTSQWIVLGPNGGHVVAAFGAPNLTDIPVPGDYDGTGKAEPAVFRPSTGQWFVLGPTGGRLLATFGATGLADMPVSGDFHGVGHDEPAVFRPSTSQWIVLGPNGSHVVAAFGAANRTDIPVPGDYDGIGKAEPAVFRPSTGQWFVLGPGGGHLVAVGGGQFGARNLVDIPLEGQAATLKLLGKVGSIHSRSVGTGQPATPETSSMPSVGPVVVMAPSGASGDPPPLPESKPRASRATWFAAIEWLDRELWGWSDRG